MKHLRRLPGFKQHLDKLVDEGCALTSWQLLCWGVVYGVQRICEQRNLWQVSIAITEVIEVVLGIFRRNSLEVDAVVLMVLEVRKVEFTGGLG